MDGKRIIDLKKVGEGIAEKARAGIEVAKDGAEKAKNVVTATADSLIQSIDQTGDGKFDFDDVAEITQQIKESQRQAKLRRDLDALNPIFPKDLLADDYLPTQMIRIAEKDKKHAASSLCDGAIGHESLVKDLRFFTVYPESVSDWGLRFYPDENQEFYYVDPIDPRHYIAIDTFFDYIRRARISELQMIAQDLGATFFKVTLREQQKTLHKSSQSLKAAASKAGNKNNLKATVQNDISASELTSGEVMALLYFEGHEPTAPKLSYFANEPQITSLIEMRTNRDNTLRGQQMLLKCSQSSGIKKKTAATIDAAFSSMKCAGNTTFSSEAQEEVRQVFEYEIQF